MAGDPSRLHRDKGKILAKDYVEEDKKHWNSSITVMLFFFFSVVVSLDRLIVVLAFRLFSCVKCIKK